MKATRVPVRALHESLCRYTAAHGAPKAEFFTETTVVNFKNALDDWKVANLQGRIHYERASVPVVRTELTNKDVEKESDLHKSEEMKIKCAEVFYEMLRKDGIDVRYQKQLKNQKLADIIAHVIQQVDTRLAIKVNVPQEKQYRTYLPLYSTLAKCGPLSDGQDVTQDGWVKIEGHGKLDNTQYVVKTNGISMEGLIPNGAYVIFRKLGGGNVEGKTLLIQCHEAYDPESGGAYTVKQLERKGKKVVLKARDPKFDIELCDEAEYSTKYRALAEFKAVL